jgi:Aspartyl protease/PDZ domain
MRHIAIFAINMVVACEIARAQDASAVLRANEAAAGGTAWSGKAALTLEYAYSGQGMTGKTASTYDLHAGAFVDSFIIGPLKGANGFDTKEAWTQDMSGAVTPEAGGDTRQLAINEGYRDANLWWRADRGGASISPRGVRTEGGASFEVLTVVPRVGKPFDAWFDSKTHLLARTVEMQGFQTITTYFSNYRSVDGARIAATQAIDDGTGEQYRQSLTLTSARFIPGRALAAYAAPEVILNDARIMNSSGRTTVPFQLLNNHVYANVLVNGKGPFFCIFDTGGHDLLMPATAKALALKVEGNSPGTGAGEAVVSSGFTRDVSFRIGDLVIKDQAVAVLPISSVDVEGFEEQGMIGFSVFRRFVTEIDYGRKTLTFIDPARFSAQGAGTAVPFVFYNQLPQVEGSFEGKAALFDIDTGSRVELTLTKPFVDANQLIAKHPKGVTAVDGWGVGGRSIDYVTRGADLTLGSVRIDNLVAGLATQSKGAFSDPNMQGNVGTGLLKRFVVTFDYGHQIMYLKALPAPVPDAGTFDRAGFWINASPKGFRIADLTADGPAAKAGMKSGEEITAVDGVAAASINLSELRQRLRDDKPGTVVRITIASDKQTRNVALTLADQI